MEPLDTNGKAREIKACGVKMHGTAVVGAKGQVVIPKDVREMLRIESGDTLVVITKHGKALAMIKTDDMEEFMAYMQQEMETLRRMMVENPSAETFERQ